MLIRFPRVRRHTIRFRHFAGTHAAIALTILALGGIALRAQMPADIASLRAHDAHQGLLLAVNPYTAAEPYKTKFGKHTPYEAGILALDAYFRNDTDGPIRLNLGSIRLLMGAPGDSRQRLEPLTADEVTDRILLKPVKDPSQRRFPVPSIGSTKSGHDKNWEETAAIMRSAAMTSDLVAPHSTLHGFFYFDVNHHYDWLSNARFYVPDLTFMLDNKALFFFEVDLAAAAP